MLTLSAILLSHNLRRPIGRFIRVISTSSNPFPFPRSSNPSPYQIFHLTPGVSQADVKQRCKRPFYWAEKHPPFDKYHFLDYDLVRLYHPDSPVSRTIHPDPAVRQARFHSITAAYEALQTGDPAREAQKRNDYHAQQEALRRAYRRRRAVDEVSVDGQWKDKLIFGVVLLVSLPTSHGVKRCCI